MSCDRCHVSRIKTTKTQKFLEVCKYQRDTLQLEVSSPPGSGFFRDGTETNTDDTWTLRLRDWFGPAVGRFSENGASRHTSLLVLNVQPNCKHRVEQWDFKSLYLGWCLITWGAHAKKIAALLCFSPPNRSSPPNFFEFLRNFCVSPNFKNLEAFLTRTLHTKLKFSDQFF